VLEEADPRLAGFGSGERIRADSEQSLGRLKASQPYDAEGHYSVRVRAPLVRLKLGVSADVTKLRAGLTLPRWQDDR
jgi:hypothetical protein